MLGSWKSTTVLTLGSLLAFSSPALAGDVYGAIGGGYSVTNNSTYNGAPLDIRADYKDGFGVRAAAGVDRGSLRIEGEVASRRSNAGSMSVVSAGGLPGVVTGAAGGHASLLSFMSNVYLDLLKDARVTPYIGAGVGLGIHRLQNIAAGGAIVDDSATVLAMQGIAGAAMALSDSVDLTLDYRFLTTEKGNFRDALARPFKAEYDNHSIMVGLVYRFGAAKPAPAPQPAAVAPPAPPPPEPAPAPAPEPAPAAKAPEPVTPPVFLVFFDFDRTEITAQAASVIREAVDAYRKFGSAKVVLTGHADRSGTDAYNLGLSQRRADGVRGALLELGVANEVISLIGRGEEDPLIATPDGVREPQNRRVEIVLE